VRAKCGVLLLNLELQILTARLYRVKQKYVLMIFVQTLLWILKSSVMLHPDGWLLVPDVSEKRSDFFFKLNIPIIFSSLESLSILLRFSYARLADYHLAGIKCRWPMSVLTFPIYYNGPCITCCRTTHLLIVLYFREIV
jgi:hypothetical protein